MSAPRAVCLAIAFAAASAHAQEVSVRGHLEWITAVRGTLPADTEVNPDNRVFALPQLLGQTELRPSLRLDFDATLQLVLRPRFLVVAEKARTGDAWQDAEGEASAEWTELYGTWNVSDSVQLTYGLQNFQWGPAELLGPSNRLFHEVGFNRDPVYHVRGKHLVRVNLSAGREWSLIVLAEVAPNHDPAFVAGEPFESKGQVKVEYASDDGAWYAGLTGGAAAESRPWWGEYAMVSIGDAVSAYVDATHAQGSRAWYPVATGGGRAVFEQTRKDEARVRTLAVGGLRYAFESGDDLRLEYVFDDAGYTREQIELAPVALRSALSRAQAEPYFAPGLELLSRHLVYGSLRVPALPPSKRLTFHARYLYSLTDGSGLAYPTLLAEVGEAWALFLSAGIAHGPEEGELSRLARATVVLGVVLSQ